MSGRQLRNWGGFFAAGTEYPAPPVSAPVITVPAAAVITPTPAPLTVMNESFITPAQIIETPMPAAEVPADADAPAIPTELCPTCGQVWTPPVIARAAATFHVRQHERLIADLRLRMESVPAGTRRAQALNAEFAKLMESFKGEKI
jgi:hypothetical protein